MSKALSIILLSFILLFLVSSTMVVSAESDIEVEFSEESPLTVEEGEDFVFNVVATNHGNQVDNHEIFFQAGDVFEYKDNLDFSSGEVRTFQFVWGSEVEQGEYVVMVGGFDDVDEIIVNVVETTESEDDEETEQELEEQEENTYPNIEISDFNYTREIFLNETSNINGTVTNTGNESLVSDMNIFIDDSKVLNKNLNLENGESDFFEYEWEPNESGEFEGEISSLNDTINFNISVSEINNFEINDSEEQMDEEKEENNETKFKDSDSNNESPLIPLEKILYVSKLLVYLITVILVGSVTGVGMAYLKYEVLS